MFRKWLMAVLGAAIVAGGAVPPAKAENGVNVGVLSCTVSGGVGFIFGSSRSLTCVFSRPDGTAETYVGSIERYGLDIGFTSESQILWGVIAPGNVERGALAGTYGGPSADIAVGLGLGANAMVGGSKRQIALQPISINGNAGLNLAAGLAAITLRLK